MNLLTIEKVSKSYTDKVLLDDVTLGIHEGDRIGVIGINGTGKSTFLKIISGLEHPDEGQVIKGNGITVEYLPQNPVFDDSLTLLENVVKGKKAKKENWSVEGDAKGMLSKLGIDNPEVKPSTLSGGQRKRAALVRALLSSADILVLDEPTNHLDSQMAQWLEEYLNKYRGAFIMVTHDRYFLDEVTNKIVELDKGKLYSYDGSYATYLELKAQREEMELASERKAASLYRMDLEWMMRGARARSTKQKYHIQRFEQLRDRDKIVETKNVEMSSISSRLGKQTVELEHIKKAYGENLLIDDFTYIFLKNDRIGIVGHNGAGKSTLLKIITGVVTPDAGSVIIGQTVKIGYFSQENEYMPENLRVIDYIKETAEYIETTDGTITASQMLERFLFTGAMQYSLIEKLSGGEKRRLYLLKILMEAPNVLILDEPTNDLDIQTLSILEEYLDHFQGIVITVSHDRYFLDRIVTRIFAFEGNGVIRQYEGGYTQYYEKTLDEGNNASNQNSKNDKSQNTEATAKKDWKQASRGLKLKFSYQEQKEFDTIDADMEALEATLASIEEQMATAASDYGKLNDLMKQKDATQAKLDEKMERWVYLNELADEIAENKKRGM